MRKILALIMVAALIMGVAPMITATAADYGWSTLIQGSHGLELALVEVKNDTAIFEADFGETMNSDNFEAFFDISGLYGQFNPVDKTGWLNFRGVPYENKRAFERDWEVRTRMIRGGNVTKNAEFNFPNSGGVRLKLEVEKEFPTIKEVPYKYEVVIVAKRNIDNASFNNRSVRKNDKIATFTIEGEWVEERVVEVDETYDYIYMADMRIIEPSAYVRKVEIEGDHDVWVYTRLYTDRDIYLRVVNDEPTEEIHETHPSVLETVELKSIGLNNSYTTVNLNRDRNDWIYDADWNFVGMGNAKDLAYSTIYYISTSELDVDTDLGEPDWTEGGDFEAETGGDDYLPNVNDNPGTGR